MKILILTALLITTLAVTANSQTERMQNRINSDGYIHYPTGAIEEEFGEGNVTGIKYAENGTVVAINGRLDKGITAAEPLDKCYQFFELHKHLFGLDNPREELVLISVSGQFGIHKFRQFYNGIQVGFHRIMVYFSFDGKHSITGAGGKFVTEVKSLSSTPAISEEEAIQIATNDYIAQKHKGEPKLIKAELIYLKDSNGDYYLAWNIAIRRSEYYIDAMTGNIKISR